MPMERGTLDYRCPTTSDRRGGIAPLLATASAVLLAGSVAWCTFTWDKPDRLIFLPWGDVGLGFKSYGGWLQWIEYAPWMRSSGDYPKWSVPWGVVFMLEL